MYNTKDETRFKRPTCNDQHELTLARASNFWKLLPSVIIPFKVMTPEGVLCFTEESDFTLPPPI